MTSDMLFRRKVYLGSSWESGYGERGGEDTGDQGAGGEDGRSVEFEACEQSCERRFLLPIKRRIHEG